ncbi:MAG: cytochrome c [Acidobacteriota bacterium]|nr:cytochrome c [Acidobacteriota bacterium]
MSVQRLCRTLVVTAGVVVLSAGLARAQGAPPMKKTVAPRTSPTSGVEMFKTYCIACHGPAGKGDGPAAAALKKPPANLSELAKRNGGTFPTSTVERVLRFGVEVAAHGSSDMPTWGDAFRQMGDEATVRLRIANLSNYLQSLQVQ